MASCKSLLDLILVPLSICLVAGYHAYLWRSFSSAKHRKTPTNLSLSGKKAWLHKISKEKEKSGMLEVQSFRNALMSAVLCATAAVIVNSALAALTNNAYSSGRILRHSLFGAQSGPALLLKYATGTVLLLSSFVCSSMAIGCINDANFLLNSSESFHGHARLLLERGCLLAAAGNRTLYVTVPFLMWLMGPVPMALSSAALVWVLYFIDFIDDRKIRVSMLLSGG